MQDDNLPKAFVAMKFESDHWRDKRYVAIREELEHAGFSCIRADELKTSGPVVDEVCRLLREAALVVIDSSGDSHSVSYEIGYCHGVSRPTDTTLLLRADAKIPFNYQHYRHRVYKDLRHLRRLVRDYLQIYEPLSEEQFGYTFTFGFAAGGIGYIRDGAFSIFEALRDSKFSGRCECYSGEHFGLGDRLFSVGIMLRRPGRKAIPDYDWWMKLTELVARHTESYKDSITFQPTLSELAEKRAMLASFIPSGVAEFSDGDLSRLLGSAEGSFFHSYRERQKPTA
jgi:hypothetical protein